ncbi:hypothetical protein [Sorangium sp. So ce1182]|uniref:hypothetical protein n=1 Tax=Sorangium sp. So ce1182 TaxID=3133334 RepID=UPI003F5F3B40
MAPTNPVSQPRWRTWRWVAGYGFTYVPYVVLTTALKQGILPSQEAPVSGLVQLPVTAIAWAAFAFVWVTALGWLRWLPQRQIGGLMLRLPSAASIVGGVATSVIMISTLLVYTAQGSSPMIAGVVTRASVLMMAPILDMCLRKHIGWHAWAAFALALASIPLTTRWNAAFALSLSFTIPLALYVSAYAVRLLTLSVSAKAADPAQNWGFFVGEHLSAAASLLVFLGLSLALGPRLSGVDLRPAFSLELAVTGWLVVAALASELVGIFGGLTFVSPQENTFCVPANRCASVVASTLAMTLLAWWSPAARWPRIEEVMAAVLTLLAIAVLAIRDRLSRLAA